MHEPRCEERVGEPYPRRCVDCDRAAAEDAATRRADQVRACDRHVRLLPCPECAGTALSGPVAR